MKYMKLKPLIKGFSTFLPGVKKFLTKGTKGTDSAKYCYSVWLRHLMMAKKNGLRSNPSVVAELGPGNSLGIGLAALLSGAEKYLAFDIVEHANIEMNLKVFDELVALFRNRSDIPSDGEHMKINPRLDSYSFPRDIITENQLKKSIENNRIERIRNSICNPNQINSMIEYEVPWFESSIVKKGSVDMIYSQAVLEHVDDLRNVYKTMYLWLKPNGFISHQIDFKCHGTANQWNGHWTYSDFVWNVIRGKRSYLINRKPHSIHIGILREEKFRIVCDRTIKTTSNIKRNDLARKFKHITDEDLITSGAFIQAVKQN